MLGSMYRRFKSAATLNQNLLKQVARHVLTRFSEIEFSLWQIPLRFPVLLPLDESPAAENGGLSSALSVNPIGNRSRRRIHPMLSVR